MNRNMSNLRMALKIFVALFGISVVIYLVLIFRTPKDVKEYRHSISRTESEKWISVSRSILRDVAPRCLSIENPTVVVFGNDSVLYTDMSDSLLGCSISTDGKKILSLQLGKRLLANQDPMPEVLNSGDLQRLAIITRFIDTAKYRFEFVMESRDIRWYCFRNPPTPFSFLHPFSMERDPYTNFGFNKDSIVSVWNGF